MATVLSNAQMQAVINSGRVILYEGRVITQVSDLPEDVQIALDNPDWNYVNNNNATAILGYDIFGSPANNQTFKFDSSNKRWVFSSTGGGGSITVAEADGSPSVDSVSTISFDQTKGLVVTNPSTGEARVSLSGIPYSALSLSGAVLNADLAQMTAHTFKGNNTGSAAAALDLTVAQLTAELNSFVGDSGSGGTKGLVPAPASGDAAALKFLKADGTWAATSSTPSQLINAQTGTTYTVVSGDQGKLVTFNNAATVAVTLPQATGSFTSGWYADFENLGAGTVTITPTTSTVDGAATITLATNQGGRIVSNGTNYVAQRGGIGGQLINALTDTWNNSGTSFNAIVMDVTNTASAATSNLLDLRVGGTSQFKVQKDGKVAISAGSSAPTRSLSVGNTAIIGSAAGSSDVSATLWLYQSNANISSYSSGLVYWGISLNRVNGTTPSLLLGTHNTGDGLIAGEQSNIRLGQATGGVISEIVRIGNVAGLGVTPTARTSGVASYARFQAAVDTTLTASTEAPGIVFGGDGVSATVTRQHAQGNITTQREYLFVAPTYSFATSSSTVTNAATLTIDAAPVAGTNAVFTNSYALWVQAGLAKFDGGLTSAGTLNALSSIFTTPVTTGTGSTAGMQVTANSLTTGNGVDISSSSVSSGSVVSIAASGTAANSNTKTALNVAASGANSNASQTTYGAQFSNTSTGTSSINIAGKFTVSGGASQNYPLELINSTSTDTIKMTSSANGPVYLGVGSGGQYFATNAGGVTAALSITYRSASTPLLVLNSGGSLQWGSGGNYTENGVVGIVKVADGVLRINDGTVSSVPNSTAGSLIIGTSTGAIGSAGKGVLAISASTAPTSSPADTVQFWSADAAAGDHNAYVRGELGAINRITGLGFRVATQFDKTSSTTLSDIAMDRACNVESGRCYSFVATLYTTSNVAGGVKFAIGGTATATSVIYEAEVKDGSTFATMGTSRTTTLGNAVGDVTAVTAARVVITGTILVNASGTLTVQFAQNASNGTASSVLVNSVFNLYAIN